MSFKTASKYVCLILFLLAFSVPVRAATLEGDFIKFTFDETTGTIGNTGNGTPGLVYDRTGKGDFSQFGEVLEWGSAYESFGMSWDVSGGYVLNNNHNGTTSFANTGITYDLGNYVQAATWSGTYGGLIDIQHKYLMPNDSRYIKITTTITVNANFDGASFVRLIDPDQDRTVSPTGTVTDNYRGLGSIDEHDIVYAVGDDSGIVVGLYTQSELDHNAGFLTNWAGDIDDIGDDSSTNITDDALIGLLYELGDLNSGDEIELHYAYLLSADGLPLQIPNLASMGRFVPYATTRNQENIAYDMEFLYDATTPEVQAILEDVDTLGSQDDKHTAIASLANSYGGMADAGIKVTNLLFNQIGMRGDGLLDRHITDEHYSDEYGTSSSGRNYFTSNPEELMQISSMDGNNLSKALMMAENGLNAIAEAKGFAASGQDGVNIYCNPSDWRIWTSSAFTKADIGRSQNNVSGDVDSYSLAFGFDYTLDDKSLFGLGYAFSNYEVDFDTFNATQESDYHSLLAFYNYSNDRREYFNLFASYTKGDNEMERTVVIGSDVYTGGGNADSTGYSLAARAGKDFMIGDNLSIGPLFQLQYAYNEVDGYTESGLGGVELSYDSEDVDALLGQLALRIAKYTENKDWGRLAFRGKLGYEHDFFNDNRNIKTGFAGAPGSSFNTIVDKSSDTGYFVMGAGISAAVNYGLVFALDYEGNIGRDDYDNQTLIARVNLPM